ncbi:hypothetical protein ACKI1L_38395, partial [Streptomyces scabiei]|uniref:hypothetical protein n=1 Tax=Streptomyces scabiei TaxID=1930 RepID=UPI0038F5F01B
QWERLKDTNTTSDENEDKNFDFDALDDYVIQRMLKGLLNPSPECIVASDMLDKIDQLVAANPAWADMPEWSWSQTDFYESY